VAKEQSGIVNAAVNGARITSADKEPGNWMSHGRTYSEERFSPLKQINDQNVAKLGLAWSFDLDTRRGQEATPLVIDGVMYFTSAWSKVFALRGRQAKSSGHSIRKWTRDGRSAPAAMR